MFLFRYFTLGYDCGLRPGMYCVSLQVLYLGLRLLTSVRYVLCFSSGILPWATTVDFGQVCIVFRYMYCTLGYDCGFWSGVYCVCFRYCTLVYDCGIRLGMYCVSLQVLYLGLRLWTSVRYVLCFSSGIVPWSTTVDFGQVCIVFLFRCCTLVYDCGLRSGMYCVFVIVSWLF